MYVKIYNSYNGNEPENHFLAKKKKINFAKKITFFELLGQNFQN